MTMADYSTGQVSIPLEYGLVRSFRMRQVGVSYSGFGIEITMLNKRGRNSWGKALEALAGVASSGKVSIPTNPATAAATYLLDFANKAVDSEVAAQDPVDAPKIASVDIVISPTGQCTGDLFQRTGTLAIVWARGGEGGSRVDIARPQAYCWRAEAVPAFTLKAALKPDGGDCAAATDWFEIGNDYLGMLISAAPSGSLGGGPQVPEIREAIERCRFHGIDENACIGR